MGKMKNKYVLKDFMPKHIPIYMKPAVKYVVKYMVLGINYVHIIYEHKIKVNGVFMKDYIKLDFDVYMKKYPFSFLYDTEDSTYIFMYTTQWLIEMGYTLISLKEPVYIAIRINEIPSIEKY